MPNGLLREEKGFETGLCLQHKWLKNTIYTVEIPDIIYQVPHECRIWCKKKHIFKTFHLNLDENGRVTVAPPIWELFKQKGVHQNLTALRMVKPHQTFIGINDATRPRFVYSREHGEQRIDGKDNPDRGPQMYLIEREYRGELLV